MQVVFYCENALLLKDRSEHTCAFALAIYTPLDSVSKAVHCKDKCVINLKPDLTPLDVEQQIILSNVPKPWTLV